MANRLQKPRGTQDVLPSEQRYWLWVENTFREMMLSAGFGRIFLPTFESTDLFVRSIGKLTDIVSKEMYTLRDKSGNSLTLRPEGTAGVVRAYIENGMYKEPQPVKLFYFGPMFRYDRPQAGRYREFYQVGAELLGDQDPIVDAQFIALVVKYYAKLGLKDLVVRINSLGDSKCRPKIQKDLVDFLSAHRRKLCMDCKRRMVQNPLRVLDCKEKSCQPVIEEAGSVVLDGLNENSKKHFTKVLEYLDDMGIAYELDTRLVRGLDYYTHTVFEIEDRSKGVSICGGGRYDELVKQLGGPSTPAIGFAGGVERTIELLKQQGAPIPEEVTGELFVVQLGDAAKKKAIKVIDQLDEAGYRVAHALGKDSIKSQLRVANRVGAKLAVIIGEREVHDKSVIIRDLADGSQESALDRNFLSVVKRKLNEKKRKRK